MQMLVTLNVGISYNNSTNTKVVILGFAKRDFWLCESKKYKTKKVIGRRE